MAIVAYWPMSGETPLNDYSGNGYTLGRLGLLFDSNAPRENSFYVPNDGATNHRLTTPSMVLPQNKTISCFLKRNGTFPTNNTIASSANSAAYFWLRWISSTRAFRNYIGSSSLYYDTANVLAVANKWYHYVFTFDFTNKIFKTFENGQLIKTHITTDAVFHNTGTRTYTLMNITSTPLTYGSICEFLVDSEIWSDAKVLTYYLNFKGKLFV